jgi:sporulation protein YlmC with PRC-barrel domain
MRRRISVLTLGAIAWGGLAAAQDLPVDLPDSLTDASSIASAAQALSEAGMDRLLIKDLIGKELTGSDGNTIGTVEDFAVIPGGRIIAALVSTSDGTRLAVPYAAIRVANAATSASLQVPISASELLDMGELQSLASSLTD